LYYLNVTFLNINKAFPFRKKKCSNEKYTLNELQK
jgi:hypothetical protein